MGDFGFFALAIGYKSCPELKILYPYARIAKTGSGSVFLAA
jgi:hypothetical protein